MEQRWPDYAVPPANGADFERYVGTVFEDLGYQVLLTSPSHGFGADLILIEPGTGKQIAVETKFYNKGPLSSDAVQQVTSAVLAWGAAEGWVVTNAPGFSENALQLAMANGIRLIDDGDLKAMVVQAEGRQANNRIAAVSAPLAPMVPAASVAGAAPAQPSMPYAPQPTTAFDPLAPSGMMPPTDPLAPSTMAPPADPYGAYGAMPGLGAEQQMPYPYPYPPQFFEEETGPRLGWLISILATIAIILLILTAYIFLAPPLFEMIESNNPGLHILRWEEVIDLITGA